MMRDALRMYVNGDYRVYGVSDEDFQHTVELARKFIAPQFELLRQHDARVRVSDPVMADDIMDDIAAHTYVDAQYGWHFCLWRLQGLLEAILVHDFLGGESAKKFLGLKAKLDALRGRGLPLSEVDYNELLSWGALRNALSHAPPEQYRPGPLAEEDVVEYQQLAIRVIGRWRSQVVGA
jgi:hypothetical protein